MTPHDRELLVSIAASAARIATYVSRTGPDWPQDDMAIDAIAKRLEEIGELAKRLTPDATAVMPAVDWRGVRGMREVLAHDYDEVDVRVLEDVLAMKLPALAEAVAAILAEPPPDG